MKTKLLAFLLQNKGLIITNLLGFYLFVKMAEDVIEKEYILVIDRWISIHINAVQTPLFNKLMVTMTNLNGAVGIFVFSALFILFLAYKKWYQDIWFYLLSVMGANMAFIAIKLIVHRIRPDSNILLVTGYSFPSGHATMATTMALAVYLVFAKRVHVVSIQLLLLLVCVTWAVTIVFSRVYLDVHWLSDVIAGVGLGLFWVTLIVLIIRSKFI